MTDALSSPARPGRTSLLLALLPFACLLWAYWPAFNDLAQVWKSNAQYSHGWLVPVFAAGLLWLRRQRLDPAALRPNFLVGLPLLLFGIGLRLVAGFYYYVWLDPISLLPCVAGLVWLLGGWPAWRWAWPSVLFLGFMVPLPYRVDIAMSGPLQNLATIVSTFLMQMIGLPALAEGNVILLNEHSIGIVEACSGLRMLVVFFALATAMVLVLDRPLLDKTILLASAIPIALVANILRITVTGVLHETTSSEVANMFFHDAAGWIMMPLALGMLWVELQVLNGLFLETPESATRRLMRPARPVTATNRRKAVPPPPRPARAPRKPARERQKPQPSPETAAEKT
jgi:exosortase